MKKLKPPVPTAVVPRAVVAETITKIAYKKTDNTDTELSYSNTTAVSNSVYDKIASNDEILSLFPDVELSIQILVSSILAPNDLLSTKLAVSADDMEVPNAVNTLVLDTIRNYINKNYKLEDKLSVILRESLFTKGAYVEALIPDVDIKSFQKQAGTLSTESIINQLSAGGDSTYLGTTSSVSLSLETAKHSSARIEVTDDDLDIAFVEDIRILAAPSMAIDSLSTEGLSRINSSKPSFKTLMRKKKATNSSVLSITTDNTSGTPMCIKLPVGSVLPIHLSNDPSKHIGYLVMLDENGVPVNSDVTAPMDTGRNGGGTETLDNKASIIKKASDALKSKTKKDVKLDNVNSIYTKALVARINNKISSGKLGSVATAPEYSDIYQLVTTRAFKGLKTRLLYIPSDNLTYFAFEYRDNGTGKSLLEKSVMLFSIRAANLFTRIMANVKNSITTTKVTATLDETDPDPEYSREVIINETLKSERAKYPIGTMNVADLVDWMHSIGHRFDVKHPKFPDIDISVSEDTRNLAVPDTDLDEMIQEQIIMSFGLKKEMVMAGYDSEFATSIVANNILFAKRVMEQQKQFNALLSGYASKVMLNDGMLKDKVISILANNLPGIRKLISKALSSSERDMYKDQISDDTLLLEYVYSEYVNSVHVSLPKVEISREEGTLDGLDSFVDMLDTYLPMLISSDTLPVDLVGDISDKMDDVMSAIKTVLIKNWVDDRNFLPEITKFLTLDNTGKPRYDILDEYSEFTDVLAKAVIPHLKRLKHKSVKMDSKLDKIDNYDPVEEAPKEETPEGQPNGGTVADDAEDTGDAPVVPEDGTTVTGDNI